MENSMKVRDLIKKIEADGWQYMYTTGSHRHFKHPEKPGKVTIPGHRGDDVTPGTLKSVLKQAGLK
jgi:predicted RNA binding protein YcfA (HicA-like mRNA interferase family)